MHRYHIPLFIYSPKHIEPKRVDRLMAQIDIPPTLLGLLNFSYTSSFYGYDLFKLEPGRERVLLGNYQKAGLFRGDTLTILAPKQNVQQTIPKLDNSGDAAPLLEPKPELVDEAVAYYQTAAYRFGHGLMRHIPDKQR
jgi:phosphoglycerol transferase MdoB-like AlkP superfamily enzyme